MGKVFGGNSFDTELGLSDPISKIALTSPVFANSGVGKANEYQRLALVNLSRRLYKYNPIYHNLINTVTKLVVSDTLRPNYSNVPSLKKRGRLESESLVGSAGEAEYELQSRLFSEFLLTGEVFALYLNSGVLIINTERVKGIKYDAETGKIVSIVILNQDKEDVEIEEKNLCYLMNRQCINDLRGEPYYSSIFSTIHRINDILDAEALNCAISSRILGARIRPDAPEILAGESGDEEEGFSIKEFDYAVIFDMDPKETFQYINREFPRDFVNIVNLYIRFISAMAGIPREYLMRDLQELNFSASRMMFRLLQGQIEDFQKRFFDNVIRKLYYMKTGVYPIGYRTTPTTMIDDFREVEAVVKKVEAGLISKTTAAEELGYNYDEERSKMKEEEEQVLDNNEEGL
ncbi:MAG: phage portal protein [candidate division WOR-3 bacterium]